MPANLLLWLTIVLGFVALIGGGLVWFLKRRGHEFRLSAEDRETEEGMAEVTRRTGVQTGMGANTWDQQLGAHDDGDESSGG